MMLRPSTYDDAVCVNAAVEINVLDYNVAVRQRSLTQRAGWRGGRTDIAVLNAALIYVARPKNSLITNDVLSRCVIV